MSSPAETPPDQPEGTSNGPTPGVRARRTQTLDADVRVRDPETGPRAHRALLDAGLDQLLLKALVEFPVERSGDYRSLLWEHDVDALDGTFASLAAEAAVAIKTSEYSVEDDLDELRTLDPVEQFLEVARSLGTAADPLGLRSDRDDLGGGPSKLLAASTTVPTIAVEVSGAWFERRREHRADVLEVLLQFAAGCRVVLEPSGLAARQLYERHATELPAHVTARLNPSRSDAQALARGQLPERLREAVADARTALDPDGTQTAVLRALAATDSECLSYDDLRRELRLEGSHPRVLASRLVEHGLVDRLCRPDGTVIVSLLPAGRAYLVAVDDAVGRQTRLPVGDDTQTASNSERKSDGVTTPPKTLPPCRVNPREHEEGGHDSDTVAAEAAATTADPTARWAEGAVSLGYMDLNRHVTAVEAAESGEVRLLDAQIDRQEDGREPAWSWDDRDEVLAVGAEFHNPHQYMVSIARALSSPRTFDRVLDEDRLGPELEGLDTTDKGLIRNARCIGWHSNDVQTAGDLIEALQEAHDELLDMTRDFYQERYDDRDGFRRQITRFAHGLAGTMVHLLDLCGIEVVRELRIPEFSRHRSRAERRNEVCRTLATMAAIQSRYGHFSIYRQLLEHRSSKREQALAPQVDAADPLGGLIGSIILVGDGVETLEERLSNFLEPNEDDVHPDAPECGAEVPVRTGGSVSMTWRIAHRMGRAKNIDVDREAVRWLWTLVPSPAAQAEALAALQREEFRRDLYLDELRVAIGSLDPERILPESEPSTRQGMIALLRAEEPISQAELARRADISTQSWRNNREDMVSSGLVAETAEGWRATLPFHSERYGEVAVEPPWAFVEDPDIPGLPGLEVRTRRDILDELALRLDHYTDTPIEEAMIGLPDAEKITRALQALGEPWLRRYAEAAAGIEEPLVPRRALLAPDLEQESLV